MLQSSRPVIAVGAVRTGCGKSQTSRLLTDVRGVLRDPGRPDSVITEARPGDLRSMRLPAGTMGPKAEAGCRFVERTGGRAVIGALEDARALVAGTAGTEIRR
jgi:carbamate kinase